MGNIFSRAQYIAKETFDPPEDMFAHCEQENSTKEKGGEKKEAKEERLKKEVALGFSMDDKLKMINDNTQLQGPGGTALFKMKNLKTKKEGLILADSVAKVGTVECEKWYFGGINRLKSEDYLQFDANVQGAYLIRSCEKKDSNFCLSLKSWKNEEHQWVYKHYLILQNEKKTQFWIKGAKDHKYGSLTELVEAAKKNEQRGLACLLTEVCIKPRSTNEIAEGGGKWDIPRTELKKDKELGRGNFGIVFKGMWQDRVEVAIKQLRDDRMDNAGGYEKAKDEFFKEARIFKLMNHPNLVQVYAICVDEPPFLLVTEYLPNGDMKNYLKKPEAKEKLPFDKLIRIAENIASGMGELHRVGVVHRDLAARNVMLDKWFQAKVGDFGLAREGNEYAVEPTDDDGNKKKLELPWKWVAPEAAIFRSFNQASDVWAFGITLWEIFTFGAMPYPTMTNQDTLREIQRGHRLEKPNYPGDVSPQKLNAIYGLMLNCWAEKPDKRPPFETLRQDLDDFEISMEDKYANYDEWVPNYRQTKSSKGGKSNKRDNAIQSRQKKSKPRRK